MPIYVVIEIPDHLELQFDAPHVSEICRAHSLAGLTNRIDDLEESLRAAERAVAETADRADEQADRPVILQLRKGARDVLRGAGLAKLELFGDTVS